MNIYVPDKVLYAALCARLKNNPCCIFNRFTQNADIAAVSQKELILKHEVGVLLVDTQNLPRIRGDGRVNTVVSCGMNEKDTVTFSSINNNRGILCVQRDIVCQSFALECGEFPVIYDDNLSIWHNAVMGFIWVLTNS